VKLPPHSDGALDFEARNGARVLRQRIEEPCAHCCSENPVPTAPAGLMTNIGTQGRAQSKPAPARNWRLFGSVVRFAGSGAFFSTT
jgi:hypothetical protein